MKSANVLVAASFAVLASAQNGLPQCAQSCVTQFTSGSSIGSCNGLDVHCICSSSTFLSGIACCLAANCDTADQASAVTYAQNICKIAGVTVPNAVTCASISATAAPSASDAAAPHDGLLPLTTTPLTNAQGQTTGQQTLYATAITTSAVTGTDGKVSTTTVYSDLNGIVTPSAAQATSATTKESSSATGSAASSAKSAASSASSKASAAASQGTAASPSASQGAAAANIASSGLGLGALAAVMAFL